MKKILASLVALALAFGFALVVVGPAQATTNTNDPAYWQTPSTGEVCAKIDEPGGSTWSLSSVTLPPNSVWTKVIIKSGNTGTSVDFENAVYYTSNTYKYPYPESTATFTQVSNLSTTTFSHPSGKTISHVIYCYAPQPTVSVSGGASATDQTCVDNSLVSGFITVTIKTGVGYQITNSSNTVIPFDAGTGKTAGLPAGSYTVAVTAASGYDLTTPASVPVTITPYGDDCELTPVTAHAKANPQTCVVSSLVGGSIVVTITPGVEYVITNSSNAVVPFSSTTGATGALAPGNYSVQPSADTGYVLTSTAAIPLTVAPYTDGCGQLITHPLVVPTATMQQLTCSTNGSFTLSTDQAAGSVLWTVDGVPTVNGTYTVSSAKTVHIVAAPNAPTYGFGFDQQTVWDFVFQTTTSCGSLTTLAFTGADASPLLTMAGLLSLLGVALVRAGRRKARA